MGWHHEKQLRPLHHDCCHHYFSGHLRSRGAGKDRDLLPLPCEAMLSPVHLWSSLT